MSVDATARTRSSEMLQRRRAEQQAGTRETPPAGSPSSSPGASPPAVDASTSAPPMASRVVSDARAAAVADEARKREAALGRPATAAPPHAKATGPKKGIRRGPEEDDDDDAPPSGPPGTLKQAVVGERLEAFGGKKIPSADELLGRLQKTQGFQSLPPDDRKQTGDQLKMPGDEGKLIRAQVDEVTRAPGFDKLPPELQQQALEPALFPKLPADPRELSNELKATDGYEQLDDKSKAAIEQMLTKSPQADLLAQDVAGWHRDAETPAMQQAALEQTARLARAQADAGLSPQARERVAETMGMDQPPFALSKAVEALTQSRSFRALDAHGQERALGEVGRLFTPNVDGDVPVEKHAPSVAETRRTLEQDPAYQALDPKARERVDRLVGGDNPISERARARLATLQKSPLVGLGDEATRKVVLENLPGLGALPGGTNLVTPNPDPSGKAAVTSSSNGSFPFEGGPAGATTHRVEVERGERRFHVDVVMPDKAQPGRTLPSLDQVKEALRRLPDDQLSKLEKIVVQPDGEPGNGMHTQGDDGTVHISPAHSRAEADARFRPGEVAEILSHEVGHLASITPWGQDPTSPGWTKYREAMARDGFAPSQYAGKNFAEDFAEAYALHRSARNQPQKLAAYRELFPARFAVLDELASRTVR